jgi:hypothetical protein
MRFVFVCGELQSAVEAACVGTPHAQALAPGQRQAWLELPVQSAFVVPLSDWATDPKAAPEGVLAGAGDRR